MPQLGIINPQNTDEKYFKEYIKAYQASEEAHRQGCRARNLHNVSRLWRFDDVFDFSDIDFSATLRDIDTFEKNNSNYTVNVFYLTSEKNDKEQATRKLDLFRISEYNYQREYMIDLILFIKSKENLRNCYNINEILKGLNTYYCLINRENGWYRIMSNWNKHKE